MPNDALRQAAKDVPADSSPATTDTTEQDIPVPDAGDHSGDSDPAKKKGRTVDEVRGEFDRKFNELRGELTGRFSRIEEMLTSKPSAPVQSTDGNRDLNSMSVAELEALRPHIPNDKKDAFETLVRTRREEERVDSRVEARLERERIADARKDANAEAYRRYPDLHNESSPLYREVNRVLDQWGDRLTKPNPYAVLQAATEAAYRLGIRTRGPAPAADDGERRSVGSGKPAPDGGGGRKMTRAEAEATAKKLSAALPAGKTFDIDRVIERSAEYDKHRDLFIRR